jgi:hypothetical protein
VSIANRQRLDVPIGAANGANRLLIYSGIAILDERFAVENTLIRDSVDIILGSHSIADPNIGDNFSGRLVSPLNAVASVALAGISDLGNSDNVLWAIDEATVEELFVDSSTKFLKIHCAIAFQGEAAALLRLSYHVDVLAVAEEEEAQLRSFMLDPTHITSAFTHAGGDVSHGTLILDRPAPSATVVKISAKSPVPNLITFPAEVTIAPGQSIATFKVTANQSKLSVREVVLFASCGTGAALAAKLTVGAG